MNPSLFSQFPMFMHLGHFQYCATVSNTIMSNLLQVYFCIIGGMSSGEIPRGGIAGHKVNAYVVLLDIAGFLS